MKTDKKLIEFKTNLYIIQDCFCKEVVIEGIIDVYFIFFYYIME
jgi:cytoskeletal protein CcmA (bactofilin family)